MELIKGGIMELIELKAKAYDLLVQIDILQRELQQTNQQIAKAINQKDKSDENQNPKQ